MVKFGESLNSLMQPGWEQHYVDYEGLKVMIDSIKQAATESDSSKFLAAATQQIKRVDIFVAKEKDSAVSQYAELRTAHAAAVENAPTLEARDVADRTVANALKQLADHPKLKEHVQALSELDAGLIALRRFVGTNVIAATKIVKKHDKNVAKELSKRAAVAQVVKSQSFYTDDQLPRLCTQVQHLLNSSLALLYTGAAENGGASPSTSDAEDADEETVGLRVLPEWLLKGAEHDVESSAGEDANVVFWHTYLIDWAFTKGAETDPETDDEQWDVDFKDDSIQDWGEMSCSERCKASAMTSLKLIAVFTALYFFICSLSFLAAGFRLVAGKQAGKVFAESEIFNNQVAGLMVGVLVTVLVQSSSTSTSICITMVGAGLLTVKQAIPIIMGANIGTSVTSTIVALGQAGDRNEFRRSFAAATVHDMFNFLSVTVLLPIEIATGYLYEVSTGIVNSYDSLTSQEKPPDILKVVTKPFTSLVIQVDKKIINKLAAAEPGTEEYEELEAKSLLKKPHVCTAAESWDASCAATDGTNATSVVACAAIEGDALDDEIACEAVNGGVCIYTEEEECKDIVYLFEGMYGNWSDTGAGIVILLIALFILCLCLYLIVKLLKSLLQGRVAVWLHASVNGQVPDCKGVPMGWLSGYLAMAAGMGLTICVQSSSITTSALTPLVGVGVIKLERMYPTVLGANIGTTITGLLAALAADGEKLQYTLAVAYSHLFFNLSGIFIFYVVWPLRALPIAMARKLGNVTAEYRWFPIAYIIVAFFLVPGLFVVLSILSDVVTIIVAVFIVMVAIFAATVNHYQDTKPEALPGCLQNWDCLPLCMRSLEPYDRVCCSVCNVAIAKKTAAAEAKKLAVGPATGDLKIATQRLEVEEETPLNTAT